SLHARVHNRTICGPSGSPGGRGGKWQHTPDTWPPPRYLCDISCWGDGSSVGLMTTPRSIWRIAVATGVAAAGLAMAAGPATAFPKPPKPPAAHTVPVRLVAINDFHGNLEPPSGSGGRIVDETGATVDAGGAAYLATHLRSLVNKNTLVVAAGDL